jgi:hypothetical protein
MASAIAMCSMSALASGVQSIRPLRPPPWNCAVITGRRVIASNVSAPTKRVAERVITATTSCPCFCSPRHTSTAL